MIKLSNQEAQSIKTEDADAVKAVHRFFASDGKISRIVKGYEYRPQQEKMAYAVSNGLLHKRNCLIEAPTGIGKTIAYLSAACFFSLENKQKIIVSTNTINLQEQLFKRDLPMLKKTAFNNLRFSLLMGRGNYICLNKFYKLFSADSEIVEPLEEWIKTTKTGIKTEQTFLSDNLWDEIASDSDTCIGNRCRFFQSECFYYKSKRAALKSDIIVTNHHLLISDFMLPDGRKILPDHQFIIWDEAHHITDVATNQLGGSFSTSKLILLINRLIKKEGGILHILRYRMNRFSDNKFDKLVDNLTKLLDKTKKKTKRLEQSADRCLNDFSLSEYGIGVVKELDNSINKIIDAAKSISSRVEKIADDDSVGFEKMRINALIEKFADIRKILEKFLTPDKRFVACLKPLAKSILFQVSPIDVSGFLKPLFSEKTNILTSATLKIGSDFSFIKRTLAIEDSDDIELDSEFDWNKQVKAFLIKDISPLDKNYSEKLQDALIKIAQVVKGGMLVLFTSYSQMNKTYEETAQILRKSGKNPIIQGSMSRYRLFEIMRQTESILFGTSSFWEGVDLPGENLSAVIITHLPFQSNNDPVVKAKIDYYESADLNGFTKFLLPDMILKLRQGIGRLIRKKTDRGVVVFLDDRIKTKSYGKTVRSSLQFDIEQLSIEKAVENIGNFYE